MNEFFIEPKTINRMTEGPLGTLVREYALRLHHEGYTRQSGRRMLLIISGFNRWLHSKNIAVSEINPERAAQYVRFRRRGITRPSTSDPSALTKWLRFLREKQVIEEPPPPLKTPCERMVELYDDYLRTERSLSCRTRISYTPLVLQFLRSKFERGRVVLSKLSASDAIKHLQDSARRLSSKSVQSRRTAIKSFLQFARYRGDVKLDLAGCVPSVASWSLSTLPKSLPPGQVEKALAQTPRKTAVGRRDYAILLLLARLGLRASEVVNLTLEDVDWAASRITIRGKMNRLDQLPLPKDVGAAIADYLKHGPSRGPHLRRLFLSARAPRRGFKNAGSISFIVSQALQRAGIDSVRKGAHLLRHTLACEKLRQGCSLSEIGEILRHRSPDTTAIYAKVDLQALRPLALRWPGGGR
jgi:integrase/recombinase XerD